MNSHLTITAVTTLTELEASTPEWLALFQKVKPQAFFTHPAYQKAWWQRLGHDEMVVLTTRQNGELVGVLPLRFDPSQQQFALIGAPDESDYLDLLATPDLHAQILTENIEYIHQLKPHWHRLQFECLPQDSLSLPVLNQWGSHHHFSVEQKVQTVAPAVTLPSSWDEYLESLEPTHFKQFKKLIKEIGSDDEIEYEVYSDAASIQAAMPDFIRLHQASGADKAGFWSAGREAFFVQLAADLAQFQLTKLYFLQVNGERAASVLLFDYDNQFLIYNSGFDAYRYGYLGVGTAIILHTIQAAIKLGRSRYDFMRGDEKYKFAFNVTTNSVLDISITR